MYTKVYRFLKQPLTKNKYFSTIIDLIVLQIIWRTLINILEIGESNHEICIQSRYYAK